MLGSGVMHGMVFAAGLGTRLLPLTERLPKPVVPLMNRPLASYALERLAAAGVTRCAVNTHHLAEEVPRALEGFVPEGMEVVFVHEPELLGTGGGLRNGLAALGPTDEPILVMNGDIFFWPDFEEALILHERLGAVATTILRPDPRAKELGALEVDADSRVRRMLGQPEAVEVPLTEHMFTGVHVLSPRALEDLPERGCVIRHAYRRWVDDPEVTVGGFVDLGDWRDLGTPAEYLRAHLDLLDGRLRWPTEDFEEESTVVLGEGAYVPEDVKLRRCVVWPGTTVTDHAHDAILAPHATVWAHGAPLGATELPR